jgi:small-conductance mechanosensitive channel
MSWSDFTEKLVTLGIAGFLLKILGAIAVWVIGRRQILELNDMGPRLAVRPYCANKDYWQVSFDTNRLIREVFGEAGYPVPEQRVRVMQGEG